jgi:hypothetical protein
MEPEVTLTSGPEEFVAAVEAAVADESPAAIDRRRELARLNTWEARTERLLDLIGGKLGG